MVTNTVVFPASTSNRQDEATSTSAQHRQPLDGDFDFQYMKRAVGKIRLLVDGIETETASTGEGRFGAISVAASLYLYVRYILVLGPGWHGYSDLVYLFACVRGGVARVVVLDI